MKKINPEDLSKNYSEERCNFLEGELKRIEAQIKTKTYSKGNIDYQKKLWALRDKIIQEIGKIPINVTLSEKTYQELNNEK